jgi:hypothetical protein
MMTHEEEAQILSRTTQAIKVAYAILSTRVLALLALLMTFGLFSWAMTKGDWLHFAVAGAFAVTIFLPVLWITFFGERHA